MDIMVRYAGIEYKITVEEEEIPKLLIDKAVEKGHNPDEAVLELLRQGSIHIRKYVKNSNNEIVQAMLE